ncbi:MAG: DUF4116 domain-containing protein [Parachlamydiales bacterium]|jgi:hypothetical protein
MPFEIKFKDKTLSANSTPYSTGVRRQYKGNEYFLLNIDKDLSSISRVKNRNRALWFLVKTLGFGIFSNTFWTYASRSWNGKKYVSQYFNKLNLADILEVNTNENNRRNALLGIKMKSEDALNPKNQALQGLQPYIALDTEAVITALKYDFHQAKFLHHELKEDNRFIIKCLQEGVSYDFAQYLDIKTLSEHVFALELIQIQGCILKHFPKKFQNDDQIAVFAMQNNARAYLSLSERLQKNEDFALQFLLNSPENNACGLHSELLASKEFMLKAVKVDGRVIKAATPSLKDNEELVNAAMDVNIESYFEASSRIINEKKFAVRYITHKPQDLKRLPKLLIQDPEIQAIVKKAPEGYKILGEALIHCNFGSEEV